MNNNTLREAGEDYLEAILNLEGESGEVRSIDVARHLDVSRPSVNKAIGVLKDLGMVEQEPYGTISLTDLGRERAEEVDHRHRVLRNFLTKVIGVAPDIADEDACRIEHVLSEETMKKLTKYFHEVTEKQD